MKLHLVGTHYADSDRCITRIRFHPYISQLGLYLTDYFATQFTDRPTRYYVSFFIYDFEKHAFNVFKRVELQSKVLDANFVVFQHFNFECQSVSEFNVILSTELGDLYFVEFSRREICLSVILKREEVADEMPHCPCDQITQDYSTPGPVIARCIDGCIIIYHQANMGGQLMAPRSSQLRIFPLKYLHFGEIALIETLGPGAIVAAFRKRLVFIRIDPNEKISQLMEIAIGRNIQALTTSKFRPVVYVFDDHQQMTTIALDKDAARIIGRFQFNETPSERFTQLEVSEYEDRIVFVTENGFFYTDLTQLTTIKYNPFGFKVAATHSSGMLFCALNNIILAHQVVQ